MRTVTNTDRMIAKYIAEKGTTKCSDRTVDETQEIRINSGITTNSTGETVLLRTTVATPVVQL